MSTDLRAQLESSLRDSYTIERELAAGGMARVFVAHETALGRRVVIKVLSPEVGAELSAKRFEREIRLAASLQQANIVPVLAAGETDGTPHYTMPFVEGLSLRERLQRDGRLPLDQTVGILRDIGRALAYAHERGVVHRDIKPENVLLSGDAAVVTDFGIAKAIAAARTSDDPSPLATPTVTQTGLTVGTPTYIAPEQILADPAVDHRADLYSFGCLAYELLAGQPPFSGPVQSLFAAHLTTAPVPVGERCPECPPALARLVMRCVEKDPASRPQSAREILTALDGVIQPATGFTRFWQRLSRRQRVVAFAGLGVTAVGVAAALGRSRLSANAADSAPPSVAVVPFRNVTGDSTHEYLADGIADGLATALGKVPGVRVVSRNLSYRYKGQPALDAMEVGRALTVNHVLTGTVRRGGGRLSVSAQLTSARDNNEIWSEVYDRSDVDLLDVQRSITRAIAAALHRRLATDARADLLPATASAGSSDPEAYDLYMRGRFLLQRRGPSVRQAVEKFEEAIVRDSAFARAHAGLALSLELVPYFELVSAAAVRDRAIAAAERALQLDTTLAEAHTALAMAHQHAYRWREAETEYQRAITLDPNEPDTHIQYGRFLFYMGRVAAAQAEFERARELDPYSALASAWVGHLLMLSGRSREGLLEVRRALEVDSTNPPILLFAAEALADAGRRDEAVALMERLWPMIPQWRGPAAAMLAQFGRRARALELIGALESEPTPQPLTNSVLGFLYLAVGDTAHALRSLERATEAGEIWPTYYSLSERQFDVLRRSPRFAALVRRVGLDEGTFTAPDGGRSR